MDFQIGCCYYFISRGLGRCLVIDKTNNDVTFYRKYKNRLSGKQFRKVVKRRLRKASLKKQTVLNLNVKLETARTNGMIYVQ